jgi:hypothetical protein
MTFLAGLFTSRFPRSSKSTPLFTTGRTGTSSAPFVTGSHLKQDPKKAAVSAAPFYVLDNEAIRNRGAVNVYELLTRRGFRH